MSHNLEHQKVHTRMVKEVLKAVARANNHPYQSVLQTLSPVIPPAQSVSGKPSTKCTRIHRTNTSRSAIPAVVLIYTKQKRR